MNESIAMLNLIENSGIFTFVVCLKSCKRGNLLLRYFLSCEDEEMLSLVVLKAKQDQDKLLNARQDQDKLLKAKEDKERETISREMV